MLVCPVCVRPAEGGTATVNFLGFVRRRCARCEADHRFPLKNSHRIAYLLFLTLAAAIAAWTTLSASFSEADMTRGGAVFLGLLVIVVDDARLRREQARLRAAHDAGDDAESGPG